jgi:hypothetical protein
MSYEAALGKHLAIGGLATGAIYFVSHLDYSGISQS